MNNPADFLNSSYTTPVDKRSDAGQIETWVVDDLYYPKWKNFLSIFDDYNEYHRNAGGGYKFYKTNMEYPTDIDPNLDLHAFIRFELQNLPIDIGQFKKAWGLKYPPGGYSGLHTHTPGKQLTAILFLDDCIVDINSPLAGNLITLQPTEDNSIQYLTHPTKAGKMVIMDGRVFHGTYPTTNERKVFVIDFDYTPTLTFDTTNAV